MKCFNLMLILAFVSLSFTTALQAQYVWTGLGGGPPYLLNDPANWPGSVLPGAADIAVLSGGNALLSSNFGSTPYAFVVGDYGGTATVDQTDGAFDITGQPDSSLLAGGLFGGGSTGIYKLSGGSVTTVKTYCGYGYADNAGTINVSGGTLSSLGLSVGHTGIGAVNQTGGTVTMRGGGGFNGDWGEFIGVNGSGYYGISAGTLEISKNAATDLYIGFNANGFFNQTGGDVQVYNSTRIWIGGNDDFHPAPTLPRVVNILGGTFTSNSDSWVSGFTMYYGTGVLNIGGGAMVDLQGTGTVPGMIIAGNQKQVINIGNSTVKAGMIKGWGDVSNGSVLNLHGGTIIARESTDPGYFDATSFMNGFSQAFLYSEGVNFQVDAGHTSQIKQTFQDPSGFGMANAAVAVTGGSGYILPPLVTIDGGSGTGATGYATIDAAGTVTGIVITNPGTDYSNSDDPASFTISFQGGGGSGATASIDASKFVAVSGGVLTKSGPGMLTLSANQNYHGATAIQAGTLALNDINLASSGITVKKDGTLAGVTVSGTTMACPVTTVEGGGTVAPGTPGQVFLMSNLSLNGGANLNFSLSGGSADAILADNVSSATGGPVTVNVNYSGIPTAPATTLITGALDPNITFSLFGGVPIIDSADGVNAPASLDYSTHLQLDLKQGGLLADFVPAWNTTVTGNWSTDANWGDLPPPHQHPDGASNTDRGLFIKSFASANSAIQVDLDVSPRLSSLVFASPNGESYTITPLVGTEAITLNPGATIAQNWNITVLGGTHAVAANLRLGAGTGESAGQSIIRLANDSHLTLSGAIGDDTTPAGVNFDGNFVANGTNKGILTLAGANTYTGATKVVNGTLEVASLGFVGVPNTLGQSGAAPANFVLTDGTLQIGAAGGGTDRGFTVAGTSVTLQTVGNTAFSGQIAAAETTNVMKTGAGSLTFNDTAARMSSLGNVVRVAEGSLNIDGGTETVYAAARVNVGIAGGSFASMIVSGGTMNSLTLGVGFDGAGGVLNQSGGTINLTQYSDWVPVNDLDASSSPVIGYKTYGCVNVSGGELNFVSGPNRKNIFVGGTATGDVVAAGIINQSAGTVRMGNSTNLYFGNGANPVSGLINLTGGNFIMGAADTTGWAMLMENAVLNVSGAGTLDMQGTDAVKSGIIVGTFEGQTGIVNLGKVNTGTGGGGGTIANAYYVKPYQGTGIFNFHGGTLVAAENGNANPLGVADSFMDGIAHAYIYPEGAKVSIEDGHAAKIAQIFEDPTGKGVTSDSISMSNLGSGYISMPVVTITGGGEGAFGATANAVVDSSGYVTGIVITNPGVNYSEAPTITISGGGGTGAEVTVNPELFVQNAGGPFVKLGNGELTLTGLSTRTGDTIVDAGILNVTPGIDTPSALVYVATGATLNSPSIVADTLTIGGPQIGAAAAVPEPGTLVLLALAVLALAGMAWRIR